jgi:hypothetical protein
LNIVLSVTDHEHFEIIQRRNKVCSIAGQISTRDSHVLATFRPMDAYRVGIVLRFE